MLYTYLIISPNTNIFRQTLFQLLNLQIETLEKCYRSTRNYGTHFHGFNTAANGLTCPRFFCDDSLKTSQISSLRGHHMLSSRQEKILGTISSHRIFIGFKILETNGVSAIVGVHVNVYVT